MHLVLPAFHIALTNYMGFMVYCVKCCIYLTRNLNGYTILEHDQNYNALNEILHVLII